jgi:hypothetical protein
MFIQSLFIGALLVAVPALADGIAQSPAFTVTGLDPGKQVTVFMTNSNPPPIETGCVRGGGQEQTPGYISVNGRSETLTVKPDGTVDVGAFNYADDFDFNSNRLIIVEYDPTDPENVFLRNLGHKCPLVSPAFPAANGNCPADVNALFNFVTIRFVRKAFLQNGITTVPMGC